MRTSDRLQAVLLDAGAWTAAALLGVVCLVVLRFALAEPRLAADRAAIPEAGSRGLRLAVFETSSCGWCRRFRSEAAPAYAASSRNTEAPLVFFDASRRHAGLRLAGPVTSVPTFVLLDGDHVEVDRVRGYPGSSERFLAAADRLMMAAARGERRGR